MQSFDLNLVPDELSERVIGAAIEVHRNLGPGLLESVYRSALEHELLARGLSYSSEIVVPVHYKGSVLDGSFRIDLLIEDELIVELKAVDIILPVHCAQLLTYLRVGNYGRGLLINFNVTRLARGVRRFIRQSSGSSDYFTAETGESRRAAENNN